MVGSFQASAQAAGTREALAATPLPFAKSFPLGDCLFLEEQKELLCRRRSLPKSFPRGARLEQNHCPWEPEQDLQLQQSRGQQKTPLRPAGAAGAGRAADHSALRQALKRPLLAWHRRSFPLGLHLLLPKVWAEAPSECALALS